MKKEYSISLIFLAIWAFWMFVCPAFIANLEATDFFQFSGSYLALFTNKIGGLAEYISYFILQLYRYPMVGALVQTLPLVAIFWGCGMMAKKMGMERNTTLLRFIFVAIVFILQTSSEITTAEIIKITLTSLISLLFISIEKEMLRAALLAILLPVVLLLIGGTGTIALVSIVACYVLIQEKGLKSKISIIVWYSIAILLPYAWQKIDFFNIDSIYQVNEELKWLIWISYGFPIILIVACKSLRGGKIATIDNLFWKEMIGTTLLFIFAFIQYSQRDRESFLAMQQAHIEGDWDRVLEIGDTITSLKREEIFMLNLALANKGELENNIFKYNSTWGIGGVFLPHDYTYTTNIINSKFYSCMGVPNEAIHLAFQASIASIQGMDFRTIKMLIEQNIIKGNNLIAEKYIAILESSLCYKKWCALQRENINNPDDNLRILPSESEDFFIGARVFAVDMASLHDRKKPLSREYMLSYLLLDKKLGQFYKVLTATYKTKETLPIAYQEALLLAKETDPTGVRISYKIDSEVQKRFDNYNAIIKRIKNIKGVSQQQVEDMTKDYKNSCYYYFQVVIPKKIDLRGTEIPDSFQN